MIEKALKALAEKDYKTFAACFSEDCKYYDYCPSCNGKDNYFVCRQRRYRNVFPEQIYL